MKSLLIPLSLLFLVSCAPKPAVAPAPSPEPTAIPKATVKPTALPSVIPDLTVQQLITSSDLTLKVGEEIMLIGDAMLSNGQKVSLDSIQSHLNITNQTPDLLLLNTETRLVRALKSGTALVKLVAKDNPGLQVVVRVSITDPGPETDPNQALVDVQVE